jgi:hypothetical protein
MFSFSCDHKNKGGGPRSSTPLLWGPPNGARGWTPAEIGVLTYLIGEASGPQQLPLILRSMASRLGSAPTCNPKKSMYQLLTLTLLCYLLLSTVYLLLQPVSGEAVV